MARVAMVTGGTRGIGLAIVDRLKQDGFKVAAGYAGNEEAAKACAKEHQLHDRQGATWANMPIANGR